MGQGDGGLVEEARVSSMGQCGGGGGGGSELLVVGWWLWYWWW